MPGVWKLIVGPRGEIRVGPLVGWPFDFERCRKGFALVYRPPFSAFVDEIRAAPEDSWAGSSTFGGREFGRFVMRRIEHGRGTQLSEGANMTTGDGLRRKLVHYVE
jgi:hypothetical protein